jgi:hypothetical protein
VIYNCAVPHPTVYREKAHIHAKLLAVQAAETPICRVYRQIQDGDLLDIVLRLFVEVEPFGVQTVLVDELPKGLHGCFAS